MNGSLYRVWSTEHRKMFRVRELCQDRDGTLHGTLDVGLEKEFYPTAEEFKNQPYISIGRVEFEEKIKESSESLPNKEENTFYLMEYADLRGTYEKDFIYEGDIVSYEDEYGEHHVGEVVKVRGTNYFRPISQYRRTFKLLNEVSDFCEIIGNIYENEYLLVA